MKTVQALKAFFEPDPHGRKVTMEELKDLEKDARRELAAMACAEMDVELDVDAAA
jgi:hypothetical protein